MVKARKVKRRPVRRRQTLAMKHAALAEKYAAPLEKMRRSIMFLLSRPERVEMVLCQMSNITYYRKFVEEAELLARDPVAREAFNLETDRIIRAREAKLERRLTSAPS